MKIKYISAILLALPALMLAGCKGRTTAEVTPDGSPAQEVTIFETPSATQARDTLRSHVKNATPQAAQNPATDARQNTE